MNVMFTTLSVLHSTMVQCRYDVSVTMYCVLLLWPFLLGVRIIVKIWKAKIKKLSNHTWRLHPVER